MEQLDERMVGEDLEFVVNRLVRIDKMSEEKARKIRPEYIRFMSLHHASEDLLSPSDVVDEFWHAHILYTEQYAEFCKRHFGHFVHHRPFTHGTNDSEKTSIGERTKLLIEKHFPDYDSEIWSHAAMCSGMSASYIER